MPDDLNSLVGVEQVQGTFSVGVVGLGVGAEAAAPGEGVFAGLLGTGRRCS